MDCGRNPGGQAERERKGSSSWSHRWRFLMEIIIRVYHDLMCTFFKFLQLSDKVLSELQSSARLQRLLPIMSKEIAHTHLETCLVF
jgi:hypothetical protein